MMGTTRSVIAIFFLILALNFTLPYPPLWATDVIQKVVSDKGIEAWFIRDKTMPVLALEFTFAGAGAVSDPAGRKGRAYLASSTMDEGAGDMDAQAFQKRLDTLSVKIKFRASRDDFSGSFYSLNRVRDEALDMLRLSLNAPRFDKAPVERLTNQIIAHLTEQENDPDFIASRALRQRLYGNHPYRWNVEGVSENLVNISKANLQNFKKQWLTLNRLHIGAVGDVTTDELKEILDRVFSDLPKKATVDLPKIKDIEKPLSPGITFEKMKVGQSTILFSQPGLPLKHPDYFAAMILNYAIGGGSFSSKLMQEVRVKRGLTYGIGTYLFPQDHAALLMGRTASSNAHTGKVIEIIRTVFSEFQKKGLTQAQLQAAKSYLTGAYALRFTNSSAIATQLMAMKRYDFGLDYPEKRNRMINAITLEEVNRLAAELLTPEGLSFVVAGNPPDLSPSQ